MHPLDKKNSFNLIRRGFAEATEITVIAPYFGNGACAHLGLGARSKTFTIYCDLFSGACNPYEIEKLICENVDLRTVDGLHAKIYLTESFVLVGSANPSANGLGFEGDEVEGLIEACVASNEGPIIEEWKNFIHEKIRPFSRIIENDDIEVAKELWKERRNARRRADDSTTLLSKMRNNPEFFEDKDIVLILYSDAGLSEAAEKGLAEQAQKTPDLDCYENWPTALASTRVIDFSYYRGKLRCGGLWQIIDRNPIVNMGETSITLCKKLDDLDGLIFPGSEQEELAECLRSWLLKHPWLSSDGKIDVLVSAHAIAMALRSGNLPDTEIIAPGHLQRWHHYLDIINCAKIPEDILERGVYMCPATDGSYNHKRCRYFGMYRDKKVGLVAEIQAVVDVDLDRESVLIKWINIPSKSSIIKKRAKDIVSKFRPTEGPTRVFLLGELYPTNFEKDSYGGMQQSKRYADISASKATNARELALFLAKKKWSDLGL